jgi:hypothetical protein
MKDEGVYARSHAEFTTSGWSRERQLHKVKVEGQLGERFVSIRRKHGRHPFN